MGVVDKHDQLVSFFRTFIKSKKWTMRIITHAFDMATVNSWLEYKMDYKKLNLDKKKKLDNFSRKYNCKKERKTPAIVYHHQLQKKKLGK